MMKLQTGRQKILLFLPLGIVVSILFFNNCAGSFGEIESSSLTMFCSPTCHPEVENIEGENLDVRQSLESYMSLLSIKPADLGTDLASVVAEKRRRRSLLPQGTGSALVNTVGILSQTSLAGEVCRVFVNKKASTSPFFVGVDLQKPPHEVPESAWLESYGRMTEEIWGRRLRTEESTMVQDFLKTSIAEAKAGMNIAKMSGTANLESANLAIMMCTTILSAPEATFL